MKSQKRSLTPLPKSQGRELRKLQGERDRALGRLLKMETRRKEKKVQQRRQALGRQVVNLTIRHTQALIDGEI